MHRFVLTFPAGHPLAKYWMVFLAKDKHTVNYCASIWFGQQWANVYSEEEFMEHRRQSYKSQIGTEMEIRI